jgi:hypothetical protein
MRATADVVSLEVGDVVGGAKLELWGLSIVDPVKDAGFLTLQNSSLGSSKVKKRKGVLGSTPTSSSALRIRFKI